MNEFTLRFPNSNPHKDEEEDDKLIGDKDEYKFMYSDGKIIKGNLSKLCQHSLLIQTLSYHFSDKDETIPILIKMETKEQEVIFLKFWEVLHSRSPVLNLDSVYTLRYFIMLCSYFMIMELHKIFYDPVFMNFYTSITVRNIYLDFNEYNDLYALLYPLYITYLQRTSVFKFCPILKKNLDIIEKLQKEGKECYFGYDDNVILTKEEYGQYKKNLNNSFNDNTSLCFDVQNIIIKYL